MSLEQVLANIPGYGGYLAKEQYNQQRSLGDLQQMQGMQGLLAGVQKQQMQDAAMKRQAGVQQVMSGADPIEAKLAKLQQFGPEGIAAAQHIQKQLEDASQMALRNKQGQKIDADLLQAADKKVAMGRLQDAMAFKPVEGTDGAGQEIAYSEAEALQKAQQAEREGRPVRVKVVNPAEIRGLAAQVDPTDSVKSMLSALPSSNPLDKFKALGGGSFAQVGPDGQPMVMRPPEKKAPLTALVSTPIPGQPGKFQWSTREEAHGQEAPPPTGAKPHVDLPTQAMKAQRDELDAIGLGSSISADLGAIKKQVEDGKLNLSLIGNVVGGARNYLGLSTENSRNLQSFKNTLEKLRNDSLRLNKGVQTEGDAVRAWNELFTHINDKEYVKQRIGEIQNINDRAVNMRKMNIDMIRKNYGAAPMDVSGYQNQPAAVGGSPSSDGAYGDAEKERRYQEYKARQGK